MGLVKSEGMHARVYATRDEAVLGLFEYIEAIYTGPEYTRCWEI